MDSAENPDRRKSAVGAVRRFLSIRSFQQKLGIYAFVLSLLAVSGVSFFSYRVARRQIVNDRDQLMNVQARQISEDLENELDGIVEDLLLWRDINQLRISLKEHQSEKANAFFDNITSHGEKYDLLFEIDLDGRIFAINSIGKKLAGAPYSALLSGLPDDWLQTVVESTDPYVIGWGKIPGVNALYDRKTDLPKDSQENKKLYQFGLAAAVRDGETKEALGLVVVILRWTYFQAILDNAEERFKSADVQLPSGYAFLFGNDADTIIGHKYAEIYGTSLTRDQDLSKLHERAITNPEGIFKYKWVEGDKRAALAEVNPSALNGAVHWVLGVGINDTEIFAPLRNLAWRFFLISLTIAVIAAVISMLFGRAVSVSLQEFTQLARDASRGRFIKMAKARSYDELGNLAQAFNEMLVSFRAQMPFVNIPNPYVVGTPIRTSNMFYGRQEDLNWIGDRLEHAGNIMILLYGARRVGKTSMLHQIYGNRASARVLPFFFDTQQLIPEIRQDSDFYHVLTRDMLSQIPDKLPGMRAPFIAADRFTPQTFRNLLEFLNEAEPEKQPVLLFDEMENLEYKLAPGNLSSDVLLFLAGLLDSRLRVSFVATGSDQLEMRRLPDWSILVPKTISRQIGLLAREDALRLIEEPAQGYFIYDSSIPERILRMTAGHPYYTQVICQTQIDFLNQNHEFAVGEEQLAKVVQTVLDNPPPPLNHVWESFSVPEKSAATATANELENENDYVDGEEILGIMPKELAAFSGERVNLLTSLEGLIREDWMERSEQGKYRFRIDLFRLWIRREHTIWHLVDELQQGSGR